MCLRYEHRTEAAECSFALGGAVSAAARAAVAARNAVDARLYAAARER